MIDNEQYKRAWESLFDSLRGEAQELILSVPDGVEAALLASEARQLAQCMANAAAVRMAFPKGRWTV